MICCKNHTENLFIKYSGLFRSIFLTLLPLLVSTTIHANNDKIEPLPISAYGSLPDTSTVKLSPNGETIAMVKNNNGTLVLMTYNFKTKEKRLILQANNVEVILNSYAWANDEVLLVRASYPTKSIDGFTKYILKRLHKYDLTTTEGLKILVQPKRHKDERDAQFQDNIISYLPDQPDYILMAIDYDIPNSPSLYKVNLRTNIRKRIKKSKAYIDDWYADQQGQARISYYRDETEIIFKLYDNEGNKVRDLWSFEIFEKNVVHILGFDLDPDMLYIRALHQGRYAVFKVNVTDPELTRELILADDKYDVEGSLIYSAKTHAVVGLRHSSGNDNRTYWDPEYLAFKKAINKALPKAKNSLISFSRDLKKYVLFSSSENNPGQYFIGDRSKGTLLFLASRYPKINESNYANKKLVHYKARDGVKIEGYLTSPIGKTKGSKLPVIILPHGGPMSRTRSGFHYWSELFANRGYVVFQPNFRGSSGYGYKFEMAAIKGWGKAMQDDLQDAAHWLIKQNIVDPENICIAGGSYGGYAALLAAVKHGDTFKCAASFAGVSDLELIISNAQNFTNSEVVEKQLGSDSDELEAVSPVNFAENINIPILLIHGTEDRVVPVEHSQDMAEELKDYDKEVRYVEIDGANHYLSVQSHRIQTLEEMVSFFDKHLK